VFTTNKKQERPFLYCPYSHKNAPKKQANFAPYPNTKKRKKSLFARFLSLPFFVNFLPVLVNFTTWKNRKWKNFTVKNWLVNFGNN